MDPPPKKENTLQIEFVELKVSKVIKGDYCKCS